MKRIKKLSRGGGLPRMQLGSTVQMTAALPRGSVPMRPGMAPAPTPAPNPDDLRWERGKQVAQQQGLPYVPMFLTPEDYANYQKRFKQVAADALDDRDDRRYLKFPSYHPAPEFLPEEERGYDCINGICGLDEAAGLRWSNAPDQDIKRYLSNFHFINAVRGTPQVPLKGFAKQQGSTARGVGQKKKPPPLEDYIELNRDPDFNGVFEVGDQFMLLGQNKIPHHSMKLLNIDYDDDGNPTLYRMIENDGNTKFHNETTFTPDELAQRFYEKGYDVSPPEFDDEHPEGNNDVLVVRPGRYLKEHMSKEEWEAAQEKRIAEAIAEQRRQRAALAARSGAAPARTAIAPARTAVAPAPAAPARPTATTAAVTGTPIRRAWGGAVGVPPRYGAGGGVPYQRGGVSVEGYKRDSPDRFNDFNIIPSNEITMRNVPYPVMGADDLGNQRTMFPGYHYVFPGNYVMEQPLPRKRYQKGGPYKGYSIVDYLNSIGENASMANRKRLASQLGIGNYSGTSVQNLEMLRKLQEAKSPGAEQVTMEDGKNYMRPGPFMQEHVAPAVRRVVRSGLNRLGQEEIQRVENQQAAMEAIKDRLRTTPFVQDYVAPAIRKVRSGVDRIEKEGFGPAIEGYVNRHVTPALNRFGNWVSDLWDDDEDEKEPQGKKEGVKGKVAEKQPAAAAVKAKEEEKKKPAEAPKAAVPTPPKPTGPNPRDVRSKSGYVNLADYGVKLYNDDGTYSPEAIEFARQVQETHPNEKVRFECNEQGCFAIANRASEGMTGKRLYGPGAWQTSGKTLWESPAMEAYQVGSGQPLANPQGGDYRIPSILKSAKAGNYVKLDRANNRVNGAALTAKEADDSYDYVNPAFFPQSTGNEHIGYIPQEGWMMHGTGPGHGKPGYFVMENLRDNTNISLPDYGQYAPVSVVAPGYAYGGQFGDDYILPSMLPGGHSVFPENFMMAKPLPRRHYRRGGTSVVDYLSSEGKDASMANRTRLASQLGISNYTGTASQNVQLLNRLRSGTGAANERVAERPAMTATKPIPGSTTGTPAPVAAGRVSPRDVRSNHGYVNLADYGVDLYQDDGTYSPEAIEYAKQVQETHPNEDVKFVCNEKGCFAIANRVAEGITGRRLSGPAAWQNSGTPVWQAPALQQYKVGSGQPLADPTDYTVPKEVRESAGGYYIGMNRPNNRVAGMAANTEEANDSYDYANAALYPKSKGYEHMGFLLPGGKYMVHGTGASTGPKGHPGYFMFHDMQKKKPISLTGYGKYAPVEMLSVYDDKSAAVPGEKPGFFSKLWDKMFAEGGMYGGGPSPYGLGTGMPNLPGAYYVFPGQGMLRGGSFNQNGFFQQEGGEIAPPEGYAPTTPEERLYWNQFQDYLAKEGIVGKPDLDVRDKKLGMTHLETYNKSHPNAAVPWKRLKDIQYEIYNIKKKKSLPGVAPEVASAAFGNLSPRYLDMPVSPVDGWLGSVTSTQRYPGYSRVEPEVDARGAKVLNPDGSPRMIQYNFNNDYDAYVRSRTDPALLEKYRVAANAGLVSRQLGGPNDWFGQGQRPPHWGNLFWQQNQNYNYNPFGSTPASNAVSSPASSAVSNPTLPSSNPQNNPLAPKKFDPSRIGGGSLGLTHLYDPNEPARPGQGQRQPHWGNALWQQNQKYEYSPLTSGAGSVAFPHAAGATGTEPKKEEGASQRSNSLDPAMKFIGNMSFANNILESNERNRWDKWLQLGDASSTVVPMNSRGDYATNQGYFRPDSYVPTQFQSLPMAQIGGSVGDGDALGGSIVGAPGFFDAEVRDPVFAVPQSSASDAGEDWTSVGAVDPSALQPQENPQDFAQNDTRAAAAVPVSPVKAPSSTDSGNNSYVPAKGSLVGQITPSLNVKASNGARRFVDYLVNQKGLAPHVAAGIGGNIEVESDGFNPDVISGKKRGDQGTAYWLAQWRGPRVTALREFAKKRGWEVTDEHTQWEFLLHEAEQRGDLAATNKTKTARDAAIRFAELYERPSRKYGLWERRAGIAEQLYKELMGGRDDIARVGNRQGSSRMQHGGTAVSSAQGPRGLNAFQSMYNNYMQTPTYKNRLLGTGYSPAQVNQVVSDRLANVNHSIPYPTTGNSHANYPDVILVNPKQGDVDEITSHEYGHKAGASFKNANPNLNMNVRELELLSSRLRPNLQGEIDLFEPTEGKADIDALRFLRQQSGLGTPDQPLQQPTLDALRNNKKVNDSLIFQRLQKRYTDDDLMYLMNTLASREGNNPGMPVARQGGKVGMHYPERYQSGGEYVVTPKQLEFILAHGGEVEIL